MIRWFARLIHPFEQAADKATDRIITAIVDGEVRLERVTAAVERLERRTAEASARLDRFETTAALLEGLLERMDHAGRRVGVLLADLEGTSKGIETRVARALKDITVDLMKIAASRDAENQRLNDEAERWRKLAIAKYEADMEKLPARVAIKKARRS